MDPTFGKLLERMQELRDLSGVIGLTSWDQETYLPPKAQGARASQMSTLQGIYHERLVDPVVGELLERTSALSTLTADQRAMVRVLSRERARAVNVPVPLVRALAEAQSNGLAAWREARAKNDFRVFAPALEHVLSIRREQADAIGHDGGERYDALLDAYEPGMRVSRLTPVLTALKAQLVPIVRALGGKRPPGADVFAGKRFDTEVQWRFTLRLLEDMGFDLQAGRQDKSIHPFTSASHPTDVRLTLRLDEEDPLSALYSAIHEGGHGLFEQGFSVEHHRTPLSTSPSFGLHESQSRLWENLVGRSRPFWVHYGKLLSQAFPNELSGLSADDFYGSVNRVEPSLIRTEADEVTYNLHIVLRYELELALIRGTLPVSELSEAWAQKTQELLGLTPPDDSQGVLQDIHWAWGELGYFPTYALGNLYSASLFRALRKDLPGLDDQLARGELLPLRRWLGSHVHQEGFRYPAEELVAKVTGQGLTDTDFIAYLRAKYSGLYGVSL